MGRFKLRFDSIQTKQDVQKLQAFLLKYPGDYDPETYVPWVIDTCIPEIKTGERVAFGWWRAGELVADSIIKIGKNDTVQLRHLRVEAPGFEHRGLGSFTLRQVPYVALELLKERQRVSQDTTSVTIQLDTKQGGDAERFFTHHGFEITGRDDLYGSGTDVIMRRTYQVEQ